MNFLGTLNLSSRSHLVMAKGNTWSSNMTASERPPQLLAAPVYMEEFILKMETTMVYLSAKTLGQLCLRT